MTDVELAYKMRVLFEQKISSVYFDSYKPSYGKVQVDVLDYLFEHEAVNAVSLAEELNVPKQHISRILKKLEADGRIVSTVDPSDRRYRKVSLSPEGRRIVREHIEISNRHFDAVVRTLSEDERKELSTAMASIVRVLSKSGVK